ncbi:hypothetical protein SAMN04488074_109103 [Lentzea albidocapillata subsp. violacea]|uniref:Uncharacterized protein n=1 Tax=Lentzea albidocapillata subsp. violacea TaxID=128104 RepID=A0A1G9HLL5_9PSEU|nr:hypothetical protein SAMN04488074_109103 [Lentzea albidocapillata subsp. violacea]
MPINEFGPDGTQAPPPPRLYPDPLAGLVTADKFVAPQWTSLRSRVAVPTPPEPTEELRQAVWSQMQQEQRRPRGRAQRAPQPAHQYAVQQFAPTNQMSAPQQQQQQQLPAKQTSGVAAFIGCLVVIGFFVLVAVSILGAIFS